jgi:hypothetical protein
MCAFKLYVVLGIGSQFGYNSEKSLNNKTAKVFLKLKEVKNRMNTKTKALLLLSIIAVALVAGSLIFLTQSLAKADTTTSVATDPGTTPATSINASDNSPINFGGFGYGPMARGMESRFGMGGPRGMERGFGAQAIQISSDFTANVTNIAKSDSDVQNLLNQGFNITSIRPVITTSIDGNGNMVTQASTANVLLVGNNGSRSFVVVDLSQAKVTKIVTLTVTEIDK